MRTPGSRARSAASPSSLPAADDFEYEAHRRDHRALRGAAGARQQSEAPDCRVPPGTAEIRKQIAELLAENSEIIATRAATTAPPLEATSTIPVVFTVAVDPVGSALSTASSHPGRNATGMMQLDYSPLQNGRSCSSRSRRRPAVSVSSGMPTRPPASASSRYCSRYRARSATRFFQSAPTMPARSTPVSQNS